MDPGRGRGGLNYQPWISVFNLCNAVVGAGVLSFPFAFRQTGIYGGIICTGLVWLIEVMYFSLSLLIGLGTTAYCQIAGKVVCQVIPVFAELADHPWPFIGEGRKPLEERLLPVPEGLDTGRPLTRVRSIRLRRMDGIIFISMTICFVGYCLVGEFGYIMFPDVESDVLKSFGSDNGFMNIARVGMALVALACYPLQLFPARSIVEDAVKYAFDRPANDVSWNRHIFVSLLLFISTFVTARLITNLGTVFSIVGATGGVMVIFIIPGLMLIQQARQQTPPDEEASTLRERVDESLKWIKLIAGPLFVGLGALIFVFTAFITAHGLDTTQPILAQNIVFHQSG